jgi:hypothetical protein
MQVCGPLANDALTRAWQSRRDFCPVAAIAQAVDDRASDDDRVLVDIARSRHVAECVAHRGDGPDIRALAGASLFKAVDLPLEGVGFLTRVDELGAQSSDRCLLPVGFREPTARVEQNPGE